MKETILICLLIITFSIDINIFYKEITFDMKNNTEFQFTFDQDGSLFIHIDFPKSNLLEIHIVSPDHRFCEYNVPISAPGYTTVIPFQKGKTVTIDLIYKSSSNDKGVIWMNPSIYEIKVDLNQKYEWKHDYKATRYHAVDSILTYLIYHAERDAVLEFKYNNNLRIYNDQTILAGNPLKILHGSDEKSGITTYEIKKGESYKIIIFTQKFYVAQRATTYICFTIFFFSF